MWLLNSLFLVFGKTFRAVVQWNPDQEGLGWTSEPGRTTKQKHHPKHQEKVVVEEGLESEIKGGGVRRSHGGDRWNGT